MPLSTEELMKPRWEVIADYPYSPFERGDVLTPDSDGELTFWHGAYTLTAKRVTIDTVGKFQSIFKALPWWKHREYSDLPEYVTIKHPYVKWEFPDGVVRKVSEWTKLGDSITLDTFPVQIRSIFFDTVGVFPANQEDYIDYQNRKK